MTFEIGPGAERVVVEAGSSIAIQPGVAHSFLNDSDADATVLNIHAADAGFAEFMRGMREGVAVEWDHTRPLSRCTRMGVCCSVCSSDDQWDACAATGLTRPAGDWVAPQRRGRSRR